MKRKLEKQSQRVTKHKGQHSMVLAQIAQLRELVAMNSCETTILQANYEHITGFNNWLRQDHARLSGSHDNLEREVEVHRTLWVEVILLFLTTN